MPVPDLSAVPVALRAESRWVTWRFAKRNGRTTKVPRNANGSGTGKSDDPATWGSYETAVEALSMNSGLAGVGFVLGDGWAGVDLDDAINPQTKQLLPWALEVVRMLDSYTEVSPSGLGVKIFFQHRGSDVQNRRFVWRDSQGNHAIEIYVSGRYFTVTGQHLLRSPTNIELRTTELQQVNSWLTEFEVSVGTPPRSTERRSRPVFKGGRNNHLMSLAGRLRARNAPEEAICTALLEENRQRCRPPLNETEVREIARSAMRYPPSASGGQPGADGRTPLDVSVLWRGTTRAAWEVIRDREADNPQLFRFGDHQIVRIGADSMGRPLLRPMFQDDWRAELDERIAFYRERRDGKVPCYPPPSLSTMMRHDRSSPLPSLRGLTTVPVFTTTGLRLTPGYSATDQLVFVPDFDPIPVPDFPSSSELAEATALLDEAVADFPFASPADRANAIGLALLPFVRDLIPGPTPLHLVEAPVPGAGKGLLASVLLMPSLCPGGAASVALPSEGEETRKLITTLLMEGRRAVLFDNVTRIWSEVLSKGLTDLEWSDRRLGENKGERWPVRMVWVATANNPNVSAEIARRVISIRLTPETERPEERTGFRHPDLHSWSTETRPRLVWALLVLVQHWWVAGCPGPDDDVPMLGSFEAYRRVIGGILATTGIGGFLGNRTRFRDDADSETARWQEFVESWGKEYGGIPVAVASLLPLAIQAELHVRGVTDGERQSSLSYQLRARRDWVHGGYRISKPVGGDGEKKALRRKWCLVQVRGQQGLFEAKESADDDETPF